MHLRNTYSTLLLFLRRHSLSHMVYQTVSETTWKSIREKCQDKRHRQHISKGILHPVMLFSHFPRIRMDIRSLWISFKCLLGREARIRSHRSDITSPFKFNFLGKLSPDREKRKRVNHISSIFFSFSQPDEKPQKERSSGWKVITLHKTRWPVGKPARSSHSVSVSVECVLESVVLSLYTLASIQDITICGVMCYHRKSHSLLHQLC